MGREKSRKQKRERPTYVEHLVDGEPVTVALPPPLLDLPRSLFGEVESTARELRRRGFKDRVLPIVSHRRH